MFDLCILAGVFDAQEVSCCKSHPELNLIRDEGVYAVASFNKAELRCYFDVQVRQDGESQLSTLNSGKVAELLNCDAER